MVTGLRITGSKGFQLSFENGLTISVQFGRGNYCQNKKSTTLFPGHFADVECPNAEIAIFPTDTLLQNIWLTNKFLPKKRGQDVVGYVKPDEIAKLIRRVSLYKYNT